MSLERVFLITGLEEKVVLIMCLGVRRQPCKEKVYWIPGGSTLYKLSSVLQSYSLYVLLFWFFSEGTLLRKVWLWVTKVWQTSSSSHLYALEWPKHQKAGVEGMWNSSKAQTLDKWKHYCSWGPFSGISLLFFSKQRWEWDGSGKY